MCCARGGILGNGHSTLTLKVALDTQIADTQAQYGQFIQFRQDVAFKGQQAGQPFQLVVEALAVTLAGIALQGGGRGCPVAMAAAVGPTSLSVAQVNSTVFPTFLRR